MNFWCEVTRRKTACSRRRCCSHRYHINSTSFRALRINENKPVWCVSLCVGMHRKVGINNRRNKRIHHGMAERAARCRNDEQPHRTVRYRKRKGRGYCKSGGADSGFMEQQRVFDDTQPVRKRDRTHSWTDSCICDDARIHKHHH